MGMPSLDHASMLTLQAVHIGVAKAHTFGKRWLFPIAFWAITIVGNRAWYHNELGYLYTSFLIRLGEILLTTTDFDLEWHLVVVSNIAAGSWQNSSLLKKCSKTNQLQNGLIYIYNGKTRDDICPVAAVATIPCHSRSRARPAFHLPQNLCVQKATSYQTVVSTPGSWSCWPNVCGTQLPHWRHDHRGEACWLTTWPLKPGEVVLLPFWLTYTGKKNWRLI